MKVVNHQEVYPLSEGFLRQMEELLATYARRYRLREATVILVDDAYITHLNREFLGRDRPTNVLAFDLGDEAEVYVSVETTRREFGEADWKTGLVYYAVHGLLHLSGYDHKVKSWAAAMEQVQQEVLEDLERRLQEAGGSGR